MKRWVIQSESSLSSSEASLGFNRNNYPAITSISPQRAASPVNNLCNSQRSSFSNGEEDSEVLFHDTKHLNISAAHFATSPSQDEISEAISALTREYGDSQTCQQIRDGFAQYDLASDDSDWLEPSPSMCYPRTPKHPGSVAVFDTFRLLQSDPFLQRMVISLSTDEAVWDAVINNQVVRQLRESCSSDSTVSYPNEECSEDRHPVLRAASLIFEGAKVKLIQILKTLSKLVDSLFRQKIVTEESLAFGELEARIKISFFLSVVVLVVVVVSRFRLP